MSNFEVSISELENNITKVTVVGFLDAHTFEHMEDTISNLFAQAKFRILIDLESVDYISSAGAGVFIGAIGQAQENGGNIVLMNPTPNVREVFDLLGLTQIFTFVTDKESGIKAFS